MGQIKVTSSVLRQKADELEQLNSILNSKIDELNAVGRELSQQWQGDANRAFQVMFQRDIQQFIQFKLVINSYIINLRLMAARYDQAESKNVALVGGGSNSENNIDDALAKLIVKIELDDLFPKYYPPAVMNPPIDFPRIIFPMITDEMLGITAYGGSIDGKYEIKPAYSWAKAVKVLDFKPIIIDESLTLI